MHNKGSKKILTVFYRHHPGGICKRLYLSIEGLLEQGYEVHTLSADPLRLEPRPGLVTHTLSLPLKDRKGFLFWLLFSFAAGFYLLYLSLKNSYRSILLVDPYYSVISKLASFVSRTPILLILRSIPSRNDPLYRSPLRGGMSYILGRGGLSLANDIVSPTNTMHLCLKEMSLSLGKKAVVSPVPVIFPEELRALQTKQVDDCRLPAEFGEWEKEFLQRKRHVMELYDIPKDSLVMITSGELTERKNVELIIQAINASEDSSLALIVSGEGSEKRRLETLMAGYGLREQIVLDGWLDNFTEIIGGCDLFVMPSKYEGISNSMLEALGAGVGVLAADTEEMREVLDYDELLFDPNHTDKFAKRLIDLSSSRDKLNAVRNLSRQRAAKLSFNWGESISGILDKI